MLPLQTMTDSSFQTLEALGFHLIRNVKQAIDSFRSPYLRNWHARISLEKPAAISFAETPVVELRQDLEADGKALD